MRDKIIGFLGLDISDKMKNVLIVLLFLALLTSFNIANAQNTLKIAVYVDGELVHFPDAKPYIDKNSRTLVPVRFVAEDLGAKVEWEQKEKRVNIIKGKQDVKIWIGKKNYKVNNKDMLMDTSPILTNSRTFVPLRFVAEGLDTVVDWKQVGDKGYVHVFTKGQSKAEIDKIMDKVVENDTAGKYEYAKKIADKYKANFNIHSKGFVIKNHKNYVAYTDEGQNAFKINVENYKNDKELLKELLKNILKGIGVNEKGVSEIINIIEVRHKENDNEPKYYNFTGGSVRVSGDYEHPENKELTLLFGLND